MGEKITNCELWTSFDSFPLSKGDKRGNGLKGKRGKKGFCLFFNMSGVLFKHLLK